MTNEVIELEPVQRNLLDLVTPAMARALESIPNHFKIKSEKALKKALQPEKLACRLRIAFWYEYNRAQEAQKNMNINAVYSGICDHDTFYNYVLKDPKQMAWIACPPSEYISTMKAALHDALEQMWEILDIPHEGNIKLMELKIKILVHLDERINGATVQKLEQKVMGLHIHKGRVLTPMDSLDHMQEKIENLQKKLEHEKND